MSRPVSGGSASLNSADYWWYRTRGRLLRTVLLPYAQGAQDLLDVGSADGPSVGWLRGRRHHVTLDIDPRGLTAGTGVCGSATALPFADATFDVVGAFDVLEHCDPEARALAEFARVLRPGGRLLMSVPAYRWAWSDFDVQNHHHRRYTRGRAVAAVRSGGFEVLRATYAFASTFPFFAAERLARRARAAVFRQEAAATDVVRLPATPRVLDRAFAALGAVDDRLLARHDLPFGSSVVVAARRPPA